MRFQLHLGSTRPRFRICVTYDVLQDGCCIQYLRRAVVQRHSPLIISTTAPTISVGNCCPLFVLVGISAVNLRGKPAVAYFTRFLSTALLKVSTSLARIQALILVTLN